MDLHELRIFATVAELASFSRAAEQLGLAKGRVSTAVQQLEAQVGTRLLQRTTRSVRLTPDGERFLDRCKELLTEAEQLQAMFQPASTGLTGRLRIDLPNRLARDLVLPRLPEFLAAHPLLEIGISTTDRRVDLVHEGFDCVLRVGALVDSDLVARPLGLLRHAQRREPGVPARARHAAHAGRPGAATASCTTCRRSTRRAPLGLRRRRRPAPRAADARAGHRQRHRRLPGRGARRPGPDPGARARHRRADRGGASSSTCCRRFVRRRCRCR